MRKSLLLVLCILLVPGAAGADERPLSEAEMVAALSGQTYPARMVDGDALK